MMSEGRNGIRDALLARRYGRRRQARPSVDAWGVADLWDNHDTHFRRPHETRRAALGRWALLFFDNALDAYWAYLKLAVILWLATWLAPRLIAYLASLF